MTQELINIGGQANDGTGDSIREAFDKVNKNFTEVYDMEVDLTPLGNRIEQSEVEIEALKTRVTTAEGNITALGNKYTIDVDSDLSIKGIIQLDGSPSIPGAVFQPDAFVIKTPSNVGTLNGQIPFTVTPSNNVVLRLADMVATTNIQSRAVTDVYVNTVFFDQVGPTTEEVFTISISGIPIPAGGKVMTRTYAVADRTALGIDSNSVVIPFTPIITDISATGSYTTTGTLRLTRPNQIFKGDITMTVFVLKR
jgi:hypothetical protein